MTDKRKAWAVMMVAFLAGIAVTVNQFKVPPVLPTLMAELHVDMVTGGWLMSVFSVAAVLLSIPAAFVINRLGPRVSGMIALGCVAGGSILGALATSAMVLLLGRAIEGISVGLIAVVAPALISLWFEPQERGLPMGIWAAWVPVGNVIMFNLAHLLADPLGWRAIWWFGALLALGTLLIFGLVATVPPQGRGRSDATPTTPAAAGHWLARPSSWLLPLAFGTIAFGLIGYSTWAPSFLTQTLSIEASTASSYASLIFLAGIVANVVAGWVINRVSQRYGLLTGTMLVTSILFFWSFRLGSVSVVAPYMLMLGFVSNFVPTAVFTLAPETAPRTELTGLALAALNVLSNAGVLVGPPLIGAIVGSGNWAGGSACLAAVSGAGAVVSLWIWKKMGRR
jgi:predicted MFS family arabinose efflux permease